MTDIVKRNMIFSAVCLLLLSGVFGIWYYTEQKSEAYRNIYLEFKKTEDEYELGVKIDPVSFIKKTNVDDINCWRAYIYLYCKRRLGKQERICFEIKIC